MTILLQKQAFSYQVCVFLTQFIIYHFCIMSFLLTIPFINHDKNMTLPHFNKNESWLCCWLWCSLIYSPGHIITNRGKRNYKLFQIVYQETCFPRYVCLSFFTSCSTFCPYSFENYPIFSGDHMLHHYSLIVLHLETSKFHRNSKCFIKCTDCKWYIIL